MAHQQCCIPVRTLLQQDDMGHAISLLRKYVKIAWKGLREFILAMPVVVFSFASALGHTVSHFLDCALNLYMQFLQPQPRMEDKPALRRPRGLHDADSDSLEHMSVFVEHNAPPNGEFVEAEIPFRVGMVPQPQGYDASFNALESANWFRSKQPGENSQAHSRLLPLENSLEANAILPLSSSLMPSEEAFEFRLSSRVRNSNQPNLGLHLSSSGSDDWDGFAENSDESDAAQ